MTKQQQILQWCDQCVLCGLCLPHCPTYQLEHNEMESPRGRIVLIQALMRGELDQYKSDLSALNHCLICRSCEAVCPSRVPYGEIIALAKDVLKPHRSQLAKQLMDAVAEPVQMQKMLGKLKLYRRSGIQKLVQGSGLLRGEFKAAEGMLKFISTERLKDYYPAKIEVQEDIQLFVGCMGESFDQQTVIDAIELLNRLGFGVKIDHPASCCGAMHHHNGEVNRGAELKAVALKGLLNSSAQVVVGLAGSCVARMGEGCSDGETPPIIELTEFLVTHADKLTGRLSSIKRRIAVHQPCTSKNLLKNFDSTIALLKLIPEIEILMLPSYGCCGASGSHMVSDTGHARRFLIESVAWLVSESPDLIISQNMGCMLHLTNEMATQQMDIAVIHPVSLLLEALPDKL